jgi:hypothetical protein
MHRILTSALLLMVALLLLRTGGAAFGAGGSYQGPCDLLAGGCAEAYSVTHALTTRYVGPLFQLIRSRDRRTLNIGQTGARTANLSGVAKFCDTTVNSPNYCYFNKIYAQIHTSGNNDMPVFGTPASKGTGIEFPGNFSCTATPIACAAPWWIDPSTGLPLLDTVWPAEYINDRALTGVTAGNGPVAVIVDGRNEQWDVGGGWGLSHDTTGCGEAGCGQPFKLQGTMFTFTTEYNHDGIYQYCPQTPPDFCVGIDSEQHFSIGPSGFNQGPYGSIAGDILGIIEWDGASATNTVTGIVNGVTAFSNSPPHVGPGTSWGPQYPFLHIGGGDGTHITQLDRDGMLMNRTLISGEVTAITANEKAFYASQSPSTCRSTGDPGYFFPPQVQAEGTEYPISQTFVAWGLRQMRASQTGPIADLRDVVTNVVHTYGPAPNGCGLDPAAATFCARNGCAVAKLYNQETWASTTSINKQGLGNVHDPALDMTASSNAAEPTVAFNGLNGFPTMHFNGRQELCTSNLAVSFAAAVQYPLYRSAVGVGASMAVVARRTGGDTSLQEAFGTFADATYLGFAAAADTAQIVGDGTSSTMAAPDGKWHEIYGEQGSPSQYAYNFTPYVDGVAGSPASYGSADVLANKTCLGGSSTGANLLSGDIAEVTITGGLTTGPSLSQFASPEAEIFSLEKAAWGDLPR